MSTLPVVSIVTPSLNQGRFIQDTILSVKRQDYPRVEHIVIDGGSRDETLEILQRHDHVVWRSEPDGGQSEAVNKGLRLARGEILGWLNSDDAYLPGAVSAAVRYFRRHPRVDLVYGDCYVVDEAGQVLEVRRSGRYQFRKLLTLDQSIPQPTVFFRRGVLERVGLLDPTLDLAMDFDFWVRVGRRCRIAYVPEVRSTLRTHATTKSRTRPAEVLPEILATLQRTFSDPRLSPRSARLRREAVSAAYVAGGIRAFNAGDRQRARELLARGLSQYPHPFRLRTLKAVLLLADILVGSRLAQQLRRVTHRLQRRHAPTRVVTASEERDLRTGTPERLVR